MKDLVDCTSQWRQKVAMKRITKVRSVPCRRESRSGRALGGFCHRSSKCWQSPWKASIEALALERSLLHCLWYKAVTQSSKLRTRIKQTKLII